MTTVIPINGAAQHGKDTFAMHVKEELGRMGKHVVTIRYADYLKLVAREYFNWNGEKDEVGRTLLQQLGTEKVRSIDSSFWVNTVKRFIKVFNEDFEYFLIPDARFPNEVTGLYGEGWNVISVKVIRPNFDNGLTQDQKNHLSETGLDEFKFDVTYINENIQQLKYNANMFAASIRG